MADGSQYLQQPAVDALYSQYNPASSIAHDVLLNTLLRHIAPELRPASAGPPASSQAQTYSGMYGQNHQQGHNSRLNGAPGGRGMPMLYNYQQPGAHQHQGHTQHHQAIQQEHVAHSAGNVISHHSTYSSGALSNASPFSGSNIQNGHPATTRGGQAQQINEHWAEQLRLHKEAERANSTMLEQHQPHYYARLKAGENRGIGGPSPTSGNSASFPDGDLEDRRRPWNVEKSTKRQDWHNLDMSGQGLRVISPPLFSYTFLQELYIASNKLSFLPSDVGKLRHLKILEASNNQITDLPPEIGMCTDLKSLLLFDNAIRTLPFELGSLHHLEMLGIEGNPLNHELRQEVVERGTKSLVAVLREQAPVPLPPVPRKFITIQEDVPPSLERVKVFSWNILCDKFATSQMYGYTPSGALTWDYRKECILREIRERDADFLALQEITTDIFREFLSPELAANGYKGIHNPRGKAKLMSTEKEANQVDGCAIFFKASKYILLDKQIVEYGATAINRPDMKSQHDIFNRVMPKDNIALICFFESRQTGARFIVANTHLVWEGTLADVKTIQTAIMMEYITKNAEKYVRWPPCKDKKMFQMPASVLEDGQEPKELPEPGPSQEYRNNTDIPLFVCGDYNSTADSSVYELLSTGHVAPSHPELANFQYGSFTRDGIDHPFSLRSAYVHLDGSPDEMAFTNYTPNFMEHIDYIWYSTNTMEVVELLGPPDRQYLTRVPGFPHWHFPSDHIQICAEFVIKARKDKKHAEPDFGPSSSNSDRRS